jgi:WD40 repeat protein
LGRRALLDRLDQLLVEDGADHWVVVTGGPGMGKSALLAAWLERRERASAAVPHHFIRRGEYDWDDPAKLAGSLVAQIEARFPGAREPEADARMHPAARLEAALRRASEHVLVLCGERLVVLIDGLDEYDPPAETPGRDPLAAFLPRALPRGVSLLCASRPRHPYVDMLAARGAVQLDLDERACAADNEATVRAFWEQAAPELGLDARFVAEAIAGAGGNLQHAAMLRQHLAGLPPEQRRVEAIPRGLAALLASAWERVATEPAVIDGLGVLCAAREALTLDELGVVAGWAGEPPRRAFVRGARELLVEGWRVGVDTGEGRDNGGVAEYRLHHDSIRGQIAGAIGPATLRAHHRALAQRLATWPLPVEPAARRYALRHALIHRVEAGDWADAWRHAADLGFLEAKCRELGADGAVADVAGAAKRCRASGDVALSSQFDDLARALSRDSHWLRAAPEATAALVWNRLRQLGWSAEEIDRQLQVPAGATFLRVRHLATRESPALVRDLVGHTSWVNACAVTPDGQRVVSASADKTLRVWDLGSGRTLATLTGHLDDVLACAVTPDGRRVVSASAEHTLKVWDLESGDALATLYVRFGSVHLCVASDGHNLLVASSNKVLKFWDLESGRAIATLQGHSDSVLACAVTPDGRHVISASADKTLKVWAFDSGRTLATLHGHTGRVRACAVTPDGTRVISASEDGSLKVWELSGRLQATLKGHADTVRACVVTPDGRRVVSASDDRSLKVWDLDSGHTLATLEGHADTVRACVVTPDGSHVVSASDDKTLKVWDLGSGRSFAASQSHSDRVRACAVTPDGRRVVSASDDNTLKIWDLDSARLLATLQGHSAWVRGCAITPDGCRVVSASWDTTLKVWDLDSGRLLATWQGHAAGVSACAVTPDGRRVISASEDKTLKVWDLDARDLDARDLDSGHTVAVLRGHSAWVRACAVTPDGKRVISASFDRTLRVWDLDSGCPLATLQGHSDRVLACAVTPDGSRVISASTDRTLRVWDLGSGNTLAVLQGHSDEVLACAVTPDGRRVVSASEDNTLRVWDLESGACVLVHRANARYTAVAATSAAIVAGDAAGAVWFLGWPG